MTKLTENVFAVEVPERASNFKIKPHLVRNSIEERDEIKLIWDSTQITHNWLILPPGNWQLLCTTQEATEEQAHQIVESVTTTNELPVYRDYEFSLWMKTAVGSLRSLLTSKGLDGSKNYVLLKKDVIC